MGFFSKLFGRAADTAPAVIEVTPPGASDTNASSPDQTELGAARTALSLEDFATALTKAAPLMQADDKAVRLDALQICALSATELKQWPDAYTFTQKLFELSPTAQHALQLAVTAVMSGDAKRGEAWIIKTLEINERRKVLSPMLIRSRYVNALSEQKQFTQALPHLDWMKSVYLPLNNTDPAYLALRGLPDFNTFLTQSWPVVSASLASSQAVIWYSEMLPYLDNIGQSAVRAVLRTQLSVDS
ncbi:hypothetical protein ACUHMQ_12365 [Chitinimonas sp. PSY-7]|uniref:hypothetical protein n=1 Tax=Chitinimonas sp. PSY-7 TaxID=3459088 RepID=UPI0040400E45